MKFKDLIMDEFLFRYNDRMAWLIDKLFWLGRCEIYSVVDAYAYDYKGKREGYV